MFIGHRRSWHAFAGLNLFGSFPSTLNTSAHAAAAANRSAPLRIREVLLLLKLIEREPTKKK